MAMLPDEVPVVSPPVQLPIWAWLDRPELASVSAPPCVLIVTLPPSDAVVPPALPTRALLEVALAVNVRLPDITDTAPPTIPPTSSPPLPICAANVAPLPSTETLFSVNTLMSPPPLP